MASVLPLAAAPQGPDEASRAIARALYDEARALSKAGDWKEATALLVEARAHDGSDSDIRYLSALAFREAKAPLGDALAELGAALSSGLFSDYSESEARGLAADLLISERRWADALAMLEPLKGLGALDPRYRLARAKAFLGLGDDRSYAAELAEAMRRFPDDPLFPRLLFSREYARERASGSSSTASSALRGLVELALSRITRYSASDPELAILAAPFMSDPKAASDAVLAFRAVRGGAAGGGAANGGSPEASLLALEYGLIDETQALDELLSGPRAPILGDVERVLVLARSEAGRGAIASLLGSYSGRIEADRDGDGLPEQAISFSKGLATSVSIDADQDGASELEIAFTGGLPRSAVLRRNVPQEGGSSTFVYADYPLLESVREDGVDGQASYSLEAGALAYAPVRMTLVAGSGRSAFYVPEPTGASAPTERAIVSLALTRSSERGAEVELVYLDRGIPVKSEQRRGGRLVSKTEYRLGLPFLEKADLDGDGRFETERGYEAAASATALSSFADAEASAASATALAWARVDADGDGLFEYSEEARFPFRKEWDLDANGSVDAVHYRLEDGKTRCEYSSRLDGRFDETLTLRADGAILSLMKEGRDLALIADANPSLSWIGVKPFDLGSDLPSGEGIFKLKGARFRIVRVGQRSFAEVIR